MGYETTKTMGQRLKHARTEAHLTMQQLADAIRAITGDSGSKASLSQYEADNMKPKRAMLLAIVAVTGYAEEWLVSGTGPRKASLPKLKKAEDRALLAQAASIAASVCLADYEKVGWATVAVYETLLEEPDVPRRTLERIARTARPA